ncbi:hypothetical protein I1A62_04335 (plasmid) [Rhodococcus sp. USK10]|uniref:hypothetical protein n=1 Tax=Rhodococcus sp. USK10 TaxID=2789739 RepID=UPI001C5F7B9F|nr:hypothetical protein [Rhodococcus sp. USK10]QYB00285.1 hypothetical protein I1A62_04335 [Rhodococcus sp. USK10]
MDFVSNASALRAIVHTIESDVIPAVTDGHAAGQLWAATGLLANIAAELDRLPIEADRSGVVGDDVDAALGLVPGEELDWSGAAESLSTALEEVIAKHRSLHYRRAVAGFAPSD